MKWSARRWFLLLVSACWRKAGARPPTWSTPSTKPCATSTRRARFHSWIAGCCARIRHRGPDGRVLRPAPHASRHGPRQGDVVEARDAPHRRRGQRSLGAEHLPGDGQDGRQQTDRPHHPRDGDLAPQRRELCIVHVHWSTSGTSSRRRYSGRGCQRSRPRRADSAAFPHPTTGWAGSTAQRRIRHHQREHGNLALDRPAGTAQGHHVREHHGNHMPDDDEGHRAVPEHVGADDSEVHLVARCAERFQPYPKGSDASGMMNCPAVSSSEK